MWVLLDTEPLESLQQSDEYALGRPLSRPPIPQIARAGLEPTPTHIGGPRPCTSCVYISVCAIMFRLGASWWGLHLRSQPTTSDRMLRLGPSMSVRARSSASRKHAPKQMRSLHSTLSDYCARLALPSVGLWPGEVRFSHMRSSSSIQAQEWLITLSKSPRH